ncbi:hypothetical protein COO72_02390 [Bifidobacterium callitrichos]|nr:hypothetical protein COO72_02390 [Bifidobacterium callitrichos]
MTDTKPDMLLWVDIETTGLDPNISDILEIGMILTDETAAHETGRFIRVTNPGLIEVDKDALTAMRMHLANGLLDQALTAPVPEHAYETVAIELQDWLVSMADRYTLHAAGTNVRRFDLPMLQETIADTVEGFTISDYLHYRDMDMSGLRRLAHSLGHDPYKNNHKGTHRVVDCLSRDIAEYRRYRRILDAGYKTVGCEYGVLRHPATGRGML